MQFNSRKKAAILILDLIFLIPSSNSQLSPSRPLTSQSKPTQKQSQRTSTMKITTVLSGYLAASIAVVTATAVTEYKSVPRTDTVSTAQYDGTVGVHG